MAGPSRIAAALDYLERLKAQADQAGTQTQLQAAKVARDFAGGVGQSLANRARDLGQMGYEAFTSAPSTPQTTAEFAELASQRQPTPMLDATAQGLGQFGKALVTDPVGTGRAMVSGELERARTASTSPEAAGEYAGSFIDPMRIAKALKGMPRMGMAADGANIRGSVPMPAENYFDLSSLTTQPTRQMEIPRYTPPRGVPEYMQRLTKNERAYQQVLDWAKQGMTEEGLGWYNTEPLRNEFIKEFGDELGQKNYEKYIDLVAATSAGARTPANAKIASYYYQQAVNNQPATMPPKGSGYGHKAQNLHFKNAAEILAGGQLDPIKNPKRYTFGENLKGNWDYATVDKHNVRAFAIASKDPEFIQTRLADPEGSGAPSWWSNKKYGEWNPDKFNPQQFVVENKVPWNKIPATWFKEAPTKTDYKAFEELNKRLAKDLGVSPAAAQAALWLGAGPVTGLGSPPVAFMKILEERLDVTAKKRNISKEQALKDFIRGKAPLAKVQPAQPMDMLGPSDEYVA